MSLENAKEILEITINKMKAQELSPSEFYKELMKVLAALDVKDEDLKGAIPYLLNFVNTLIRNMEK